MWRLYTSNDVSLVSHLKWQWKRVLLKKSSPKCQNLASLNSSACVPKSSSPDAQCISNGAGSFGHSLVMAIWTCLVKDGRTVEIQDRKRNVIMIRNRGKTRLIMNTTSRNRCNHAMLFSSSCSNCLHIYIY